jgi:hypothetical protein
MMVCDQSTSNMGYWGVFDKDKPQELWGLWETIFRFFGAFTYPLIMGVGFWLFGMYIMKKGKLWGCIPMVLGILIYLAYFQFNQG